MGSNRMDCGRDNEGRNRLWLNLGGVRCTVVVADAARADDSVGASELFLLCT